MPEMPELPPIAGEPISLVLLAYNVRHELEPILEAWNRFLLDRGTPFEVILVDDASPDGTGSLAEELALTLPLKVLRHERPRGEGAALRAGLDAAGHPLVVYAPCHSAYGPEHLPRLMRQIDQVHLVSGYRAGRPVPLVFRGLGLLWRGFARILFSVSLPPLPGWLGLKRHFGQWLARAFFGVRLKDVACPYRVLRREVLPRTPLQSSGTFAHTELLAKANFTGRVLSEDVPLPINAERPRDDRPNHVFRDAKRVFTHPDFGPARLESAAKEPPSPPASEPEVPPVETTSPGPETDGTTAIEGPPENGTPASPG